MCPCEDCIRAVKLYIKLGKRTAPTIGSRTIQQRIHLRVGIGNTSRNETFTEFFAGAKSSALGHTVAVLAC